MITVRSKLYVAGFCKNIGALTMRGEPWAVTKFPAICALIQHPSGRNILFDTGYAKRFHTVTQKLPYKFYAWFTPVTVTAEDELHSQLLLDGLRPQDIDTVILSHFHADHLGGIKDFPDVTVIASQKAFDAAQALSPIQAVKTGFIPDLIPGDFKNRMMPLEKIPTVPVLDYLPGFQSGWDLFGDGSVLAVPLPGHAKDQFGIYFQDAQHGEIFLVADAAWSSRAIRENRLPSSLAYSAFDSGQDYDRVMGKLHHLTKTRPEVKLVPSHCSEIWKEIDNARPL
ncbi:MBL fold metallo-hydrolase [Rhizobium sp. MHM7A]|uniref:MBL fold metallo-hydrolase n=1 Tax=Rhizobium sp. MHM7A TaxID=2583233 RepID=UPI001105FADE|nr:MBL fold metallo-hydrolase [Rhizobium sp. MHM7A]TLX15964.1 MBL fold metallo-hydrolase [Rhizobium sp. MHM7A]